MMTLNEYKKHLIDYYVYETDNTEECRVERKKTLENIYKDEYLQEIINNTYDFIKIILKTETLEEGYCSFEIEDYKIKSIDLNLKGGWYSDYLYYDNEGKIISEYILKQEFGRFFDIHIENKKEPVNTEDKTIVSYIPHYYLYMQGFPKNLKEIKEALIENTKRLIRTDK